MFAWMKVITDKCEFHSKNISKTVLNDINSFCIESKKELLKKKKTPNINVYLMEQVYELRACRFY